MDWQLFIPWRLESWLGGGLDWTLQTDLRHFNEWYRIKGNLSWKPRAGTTRTPEATQRNPRGSPEKILRIPCGNLEETQRKPTKNLEKAQRTTEEALRKQNVTKSRLVVAELFTAPIYFNSRFHVPLLSFRDPIDKLEMQLICASTHRSHINIHLWCYSKQMGLAANSSVSSMTNQ